MVAKKKFFGPNKPFGRKRSERRTKVFIADVSDSQGRQWLAHALVVADSPKRPFDPKLGCFGWVICFLVNGV